jgi:hypothetical protein
LVEASRVGAYLNQLNAERQRLNGLIPSLASIPRLVDSSVDGMGESEVVTVGAAALQLLPALIFGHSLEQIAHTRGAARTLREVALLLAANLIRLEPPRTDAQPRSLSPGLSARQSSSPAAAAWTSPAARVLARI